MKPNITFLMSSAGTAYGGSETYILNVAKNLSDDFNVGLILGKGKFTNDFNSLADENIIKYLSVPFISRNSKFSALLRKTKLHEKINDFDIEAITIMASTRKINKFISDSDILEVQYPTESLIFPFLQKNIKKIVHFHGTSPPSLYANIKNKINKYTDAFITCSKWSKKLLEQTHNIENIKVIYNGVDANFFKPGNSEDFTLQQDYNHDLPRIGTVGRLSSAKGTDLLFKVASELEGIAEFFAVGPCEEDLIQQIKRSNISNFHLLGPLPNNALPPFYNFIDCFVLPSLFEAFGITLIEAMSCGKPVIASDVGGIPEIVDDGCNGILVDPGNYMLLKEAIIRIIYEKNLRIDLGESARQKIIKNFTFKKTCRELRDFYSSLIN